jgi:hypothetical protein
LDKRFHRFLGYSFSEHSFRLGVSLRGASSWAVHRWIRSGRHGWRGRSRCTSGFPRGNVWRNFNRNPCRNRCSYRRWISGWNCRRLLWWPRRSGNWNCSGDHSVFRLDYFSHRRLDRRSNFKIKLVTMRSDGRCSIHFSLEKLKYNITA